MYTKIHFRPYNPKQNLLFPERLDKDIAENDPVRVIDAVIDDLKLDNFKKLYKETGRCPYHPKMMLKVIIYGYMNNLYSCRKIETALKRDVHFIWLAGYEQPDPFHSDNFYYNEKDDYYVCPMGQHLNRIGTKHTTTASGYRSESARYRAQNCKDCPLRCSCYKSKANRRTIEVNHRLKEYKRNAAERLTSEEGLKHRGRRCIEPEAVFGQMKTDMNYKRFRYMGKDKVAMDFAFFAIAFNIKKMARKIAKTSINGGNNPKNGNNYRISPFLPFENRIFWRKPKIIAA